MLRRVTIQGAADGLPQALSGALGGLAQRRLELGAGQFDRVEVGAVGRQVDELGALCRDGLGDAGDLVAAQIVELNDVVGSQGRRQHLFDISAEALAIDRAVEDTGRGDAAAAQAGDQRGHHPMPVRH